MGIKYETVKETVEREKVTVTCDKCGVLIASDYSYDDGYNPAEGEGNSIISVQSHRKNAMVAWDKRPVLCETCFRQLNKSLCITLDNWWRERIVEEKE